MNKEIKAIIWDFDGNIVHTPERHLNAAKKIIERITGKSADEFSMLKDWKSYVLAEEKYGEWRVFYAKEFGLTEEQVDEVGELWAEYELKDKTPIPIYKGVPKIISALQKLPQGIVSENVKQIIERSLKKAGLLKYFECILGYEEVDIRRQKPYPDGLLLCIKELTNNKKGYYVYIGDRDLDVETAINANKYFEKKGLNIKIITIATLYGSHFDDCKEWEVKPDYVATKPLDIIDAIQKFNPNYKMRGGVLVKG